jgi:hypothetical protein
MSRPTLPIVVAEWPKNEKGEKVRVTLDSFKGHDTIDARVWWPGDDGHLRAGKGLTVGIRHLPALAAAFAEALALAREHGLIGGDP